MIGDCFWYRYGGPGPDYQRVVVIGETDDVFFFRDLDTTQHFDFSIGKDNKALTRMGAEDWRSAICSEPSLEFSNVMQEAYNKFFHKETK